MNSVIQTLICILILSAPVHTQIEKIWQKISSGEERIYNIKFFNSVKGYAETSFGDFLATTDGGSNWSFTLSQKEQEKLKKHSEDPDDTWSVDIFCTVLKSEDGGKTWTKYSNKEDHFCSVYFQDANTGWKVASGFLKEVVKTALRMAGCQSVFIR